MRLYDMSAEVRALLDYVAELDGEVDAETERRLDELAGDMSAKVARCCEVLRELRAESLMFKEEEDRLASKRASVEKRRQRLREYVSNCLAIANRHKLKAGTFTVSLSPGRQSVCVEDAAEIPPGFLVHPPAKPDKAAIAAALKAGHEVPGATLVEGEPVLRVT